MNDNKKFSIREYREALYNDIVRCKKEQRRKWQAKYLQKLGVETPEDLTRTQLEDKKTKEERH